MKSVLFLSLLVVQSFLIRPVSAQAIPPVSLGKIVRSGTTVEFPIEASAPFYAGNNRFVLHIGIHSFLQYRQSVTEENKGQLSFLIPSKEFDALPEGVKMFLSYGDIVDMDEAVTEQQSAALPNICTSLGTFNRKKLSR